MAQEKPMPGIRVSTNPMISSNAPSCAEEEVFSELHEFIRLGEVRLDCVQDLLSVTDGVGFRLERHRQMSSFDGHDELEEVAVPNHNVAQATTVDVASLSGQRQDGGVDEQFLVAVGLGSGGEAQIRALA